MLTVSRKRRRTSLGSAASGMDHPHSGNVYCGQMNQYFRYFLGGMDAVCSGTKEEKDHPDCYQQQVQKPGSVMVWGCVSALGKGNCTAVMGTINAEKYIEIWSTICCLQEDIFSRDVHAYFNKTMQNHILHTLQSPGCGGRGYGYLTGLPAVPTCLQKRMCGAFWSAKCDNEDPVLLPTLRLVCRKNGTKLHLKHFITWCLQSLNVF